MPDAFHRFAGHIIEVRCIAADHRAQANDGVVALLPRQLAHHHRQFPRPGNLHYFDIVGLPARARQRVQRPAQQAFADEAVEPAHHNRELQTRRCQLTFNHFRLVSLSCERRRALFQKRARALAFVFRGRGQPKRRGFESQALFEAAAFGLTTATEDKREGTRAFLEKRAAVFAGK